MAKKICVYCDNYIDEDSLLCPICGASQSVELPEYGGPKYGAKRAPEYRGQVLTADPNVPSPARGTLQPQYGTPTYLKDLEQQEKDRMAGEERKAGRRRRVLITLIICAAVLLLCCFYFLAIVLYRNSFLAGGEKLREAIPTYGYTINQQDYHEMKIMEMTCRDADGIFSFEAAYDVTLEDDRMQHRLTLDLKGHFTFPFGWEVTEAVWSERTQGEIIVKPEGMGNKVSDMVKDSVPTKQIENFSMWTDQDRPNIFYGSAVIGNTEGTNYTIMGAYGFNGVITTASDYGGGNYDYSLTIRRDSSRTMGENYTLSRSVLDTVFVQKLEDGELRLQLTGVSSEGVTYEAYRSYNNGQPPVEQKGVAELQWDSEGSAVTEYPYVSDCIFLTIELKNPQATVEVDIWLDSLDVYYNDEDMEQHWDEPLKPERPEEPAVGASEDPEGTDGSEGPEEQDGEEPADPGELDDLETVEG